jgi:hypothetical protein
MKPDPHSAVRSPSPFRVDTGIVKNRPDKSHLSVLSRVLYPSRMLMEPKKKNLTSNNINILVWAIVCTQGYCGRILV